MAYEKIKIGKDTYAVVLVDSDINKVYMTTIKARNDFELEEQIKDLQWIGREIARNECFANMPIIKL